MPSSIESALKVLVKEGMKKEEPVKLKRALKEIERDARRYNWTDDQIETLPNEWQWRVCTARFQLGYLDYRGWSWRNPRNGHDPFDFPKWNVGLPVYPLRRKCTEPERVKRLLIYSEQGIGDQIMFAQALNYALPYAEHITLEIEPRLGEIFKRSFPDIHIHSLKDLRDASWVEEPFDAKILMGDLVARFLRKDEYFIKGQYLFPDPVRVEFWKEWLKDKPKTGYTFAGRQGYVDPNLLPEEGINLQYGEWEPRRTWITPPIDLKEDLDDVFAITANLEKLVTVANTNANISGCMNIPTEVILTPGEGQVNNAVNYRFGMPGDRKMRWHGSLRLYRNFNQWKSRS